MTVSELIQELQKLNPSKEVLCESSRTVNQDGLTIISPIESITEYDNFVQLVFKEW